MKKVNINNNINLGVNIVKELVHGGDIYTKRNTKEKIIDFSANINPLGLPSSVKKAIIDNIDNYESYPDPLCRELREKLSNNIKINKNNIICGNGAADLIFKITIGLKPKKALLIAPTFAEYEEALNLVDSEIQYYTLNEQNNFMIDEDILDFILPELDIMFICNPNNPTGIAIKKEEVIKIAEVCKRNNITLVVDECFTDFLIDEHNYSICEYLNKYDNVIILKAFTKIYAMAGIRLGYMLCSNEHILNKVSNIGQPWSVSTVASKCGVAALDEEDYVNKTKLYIKENREYLIKELINLGYKVFPSQVNYILFKSEDSTIKEKLEHYGILIRSCSNYKILDEKYFRIAVKSKEYNEYLIKCLKNIGECNENYFSNN